MYYFCLPTDRALSVNYFHKMSKKSGTEFDHYVLPRLISLEFTGF